MYTSVAYNCVAYINLILYTSPIFSSAPKPENHTSIGVIESLEIFVNLIYVLFGACSNMSSGNRIFVPFREILDS